MHNFAADVNGRAKGLQSDFDNVNGAHHASTKTARFEQQHPLLAGGSLGAVTVRDGVEDSCSHTASIPIVLSKGRKIGGRAQGGVAASGSAAKLDDAPAVAFGGAVLGQGRELAQGLALGCCLGARHNAGFALAEEGLRHRRGAAHLAEGENLNLKVPALILHFEMVAGAQFAGGLGGDSVRANAAQIAGL